MYKFGLVVPHLKPKSFKRMAKPTQKKRTVHLLQRDFKKRIPGLALLTDITYLPYGQSKLSSHHRKPSLNESNH